MGIKRVSPLEMGIKGGGGDALSLPPHHAKNARVGDPGIGSNWVTLGRIGSKPGGGGGCREIARIAVIAEIADIARHPTPESQNRAFRGAPSSPKSGWDRLGIRPCKPFGILVEGWGVGERIAGYRPGGSLTE